MNLPNSMVWILPEFMDLPDIFRRVDLCTFHKDIEFQSLRIFRFFPVNCSLVITASNLLTLKMRAAFLKISAKHQISHFPNTGNMLLGRFHWAEFCARGVIFRAWCHFPPKLCSNKVESSSTFSVARKMSLRAQYSA